MQARVLWLVTARSGSKGVVHKNIRPLGALPLLGWCIQAARKVGGEVWCSTDSEEYAALAEKAGARVPFLRPPELSGDRATSMSVCLHAMEYAQEKGMHFDVLGLLQPTSPFVRACSLQRGLDVLLSRPEAHAAVAVKSAHPSSLLIQANSPYLDVLAERIAAMSDSRRQALPEEITPCGAFYLTRWKSLLDNPTFFAATTVPVLLKEPEVLDIDSEMDFAFAEFLVASGWVVAEA